MDYSKRVNLAGLRVLIGKPAPMWTVYWPRLNSVIFW